MSRRLSNRLLGECRRGVTARQFKFLFEMCQFFSYCEQHELIKPNTLRGQVNAVFRLYPYAIPIEDGEEVIR